MDLQFFGGDEESGSVFIVQTKIDAGMFTNSHKHKHAHSSVLVSGTADVTIDGVTTRMTGYKLVTIPKDTTHMVEAVTDVIWLCLWAGDEVSHKEAQEALKTVKAYNELEM